MMEYFIGAVITFICLAAWAIYKEQFFDGSYLDISSKRDLSTLTLISLFISIPWPGIFIAGLLFGLTLSIVFVVKKLKSVVNRSKN